MIGRSFDRYRVVGKLGQGGMGVVYKARDTVLDRFVALKVLPVNKSSDPERRRRFLHEAKSLSALNHPGIVAVHDILDVDGQDVLVMELVDGETLETFVARKRLPLGEALGLAIGIADALARAHASGIVHRDLKPANVMVTPDGVKVLDFGLAKLTDATYIDPESPTISPDETSMTRERAILGTVPWMSPEQASGESVDARSDIFSFGILLYELLTGRHPFRRGTTAETLAAIRNTEPEKPSSLVPSLPTEAERAVLRCLHKNPTRRWQNLSDLGAVLEDLKEDTDSGRRVVAEPATKSRRLYPALVAAVVVALVAAVSLVVLLTRRPAHSAVPLDLHRLTYEGGASTSPAISPDGNLVAFSSDRGPDGNLDIWLRHINQPEPFRLTDHPAADWLPRFSPDGSLIVFRSRRDGGGIYVINSIGGEPRKVIGNGLFPDFSPDGSYITYAEDPHWAPNGLCRMFRIPVDGGSPEPVAPGFGVWRPPSGASPVFSPDGSLIIFPGAPLDDPGKSDWWVVPFPDGEPRSSGVKEAFPRIDVVQLPSVWLPGQLLILGGTTIGGVNLYSIPITADGDVGGPPEPLTSGPGMTWMPSVSANGRIALSRFQWVIYLWEVALNPENGHAVGQPRRITDDAAPKFSFSLGRDGNLLAFSAFAGPRGARRTVVRIQDRASGTEITPISRPRASLTLRPVLSPDGKILIWSAFSGGKWTSFMAPVDDPVVQELCSGCNVVDFFAEGADVLVRSGDALVRRRIADGAETTILKIEEGTFLDADLSSDDRWVAVKIGEPGGSIRIIAAEVGEEPADRDTWVEVVGEGAWMSAPRWSADGRFLYYLSDRDDFSCVWATPFDPETKTMARQPIAIVHAHGSSMQMSQPQRGAWTLAAASDRLIFNAAEMTGEIYTAMLEPE